MAIVEQLNEAVRRAQQLGADVRMEYLGETPGGLCRLGGQVRIYLDLAASPAEQLEMVTSALTALESHSRDAVTPLSAEKRSRRAA
ncbi:MAG: hypothetical protein MPJ50_08535 [Pirellulales bacterium]|nr:hypothetical protein [Pirellulales bacterium]